MHAAAHLLRMRLQTDSEISLGSSPQPPSALSFCHPILVGRKGRLINGEAGFEATVISIV
jgi:hypothetical protein